MPPQAGQPNDQLNQIAEKIKSASSVLVTVSANPSIDQLAACIGLTLAINKMGKHGTAVYSGKTPSTIEFLKPEKTLESDTNSLRDFIISLDKSKADKLRYKVEDNVVKIFITPYKTSISEKDFDFSQGDFNVDVVLALGVGKKADLDRAITSHGRILHDASVISVNTAAIAGQSPIGSMEWVAAEASSLCEMAADLINELDSSILDNQIATALLTGVVVETARFSNEKSRPHTMQVSGKLMESGASTQLITTKLEQPAKPAAQTSDKTAEDGVLEIDHPADAGKSSEIPPVAPADRQPKPKQDGKPPAEKPKETKIEDKKQPESNISQDTSNISGGPSFVLEPPRMGSRLTANDIPEHENYDPTTDPMSQIDSPSIIQRPKKDEKSAKPADDMSGKTLNDIEESVDSPHLDQSEHVPPPPPLDDVRSAVEQAADSDKASSTPDPTQFDPQNFQVEENSGRDEENNKPPSSPAPPVPPPMVPPES
jgi:hypothetical protein